MDAGSVVLVRIKEDPKSFKLIGRAEDGTADTSLLREPHGHTVTEKMVSAMNAEFDLDLLHHQPERLDRLGNADVRYLPIGRRQWKAGEEPTALRGPIGR